MTGAVFYETLRRTRGQVLFWGIGIGLMGFVMIPLLPSFAGIEQIQELLQVIPPVLLKALGANDLEYLATPEGLLSFRYFGFGLLLFALYGVTAGLSVTANEEDQGILDILLSLPLPRRRVVMEKLLAYGVDTVLIVLLTFVLLLLGLVVTPEVTLRIDRLFLASLNLIPSTLLVLTATALLGALLRRRGQAALWSAVLVIGSFFVDFIGKAASDSAAGMLRVISFFSYYDGANVMKNGLNLGSIALLLILSAGLAVVAQGVFERRDIGI